MYLKHGLLTGEHVCDDFESRLLHSFLWVVDFDLPPVASFTNMV